MAKFKIQKEPLQPHFLGLNIDAVGQATGCLKHCGLKLYLYLMSNSDGFVWNMNPVALANWLRVDYSDSSEARNVRNVINRGIVDLKENGFLKEIEKDSYVISEQIVPEWLEQSFGTKVSTQESSKEQIVPKILDNESAVLEQKFPKIEEQNFGTKVSNEDAPVEQNVPNCYGF